MKKNVVRMVDHVDDNRLWSPAQCLRELADQIEAGEVSVDGIVMHLIRRCPEHREEILECESRVVQMNIYEQLWVLETARAALLGCGEG